MTPRTLERLKYYVGKTATITTTQINRNFTEQQAREYFVTEVQEVTKDGIWGIHPLQKTVNFYAMHSIISIHEEIVLDPNNPEHAELLQKAYEDTGTMPVSDVSPHRTPELPIIQKQTPVVAPPATTGEDEVPFVDINNLANLARQTKKNYDNYEKVQKALNS